MIRATTNRAGRIHSPGRVLLVLQQPVLTDLVRLALNHGALMTRTVRDVAEAAAILQQWHPHLAVVDMDIARGDTVCRLGSQGPSIARIPVVALTRRGDLKTKLAAFEWGVDDVVTLPFSPEELMARILVVLRRTYRTGIVFTPTIRLGDLEIDILNRRVRAGTSELHLTPVEQSLLYLLATNAGNVLSREEILDALWGIDYVADSNLVDRHIRNLRAKLENDLRRPRYIATVPGRGYRFVPTATDRVDAFLLAGGAGSDEETS